MSAAHRRFSSPLLHVADFKRSTRPLTAEQFAQAKHSDIMGNFEPEDEDYITLRAQNMEDAKREAEERWQRRPQDGAIGYDIWQANWTCAHSVRVSSSQR